MEPTNSNSKKTQLLYKLFLRGYKSPILSIGMGQRSRSNSCLLPNDYHSKTSPEQTEQRYKRRQRIPDNDPVLPPPFLSLCATAHVDPIDEVSVVDSTNSVNVNVNVVELDSETNEDYQYRRPESKLSNLTWACETLDKRKDLIADFFQRSILKQRQDHQEQERDLPHLVEARGPQSVNNYSVLNINHDASSLSPEPIYAEICGESDIKRGISCYSTVGVMQAGDEEDRDRDQVSQVREAEVYDTVQEFTSEEGSKDGDHVYENLDIIRHELLLKHEKEINVDQVVDCRNFPGSPLSRMTTPADESDKSDKSGEVDEESIIENKPAIKSYWETKMRENAASQFARSNFGVTSPTITDKINEEIREDYMRNLELMHDEGLPRSSDSDTSDEPIEFDSFDMASSSNGSSPFGQPNDASSPLMMPESPSLIDSGHQSQESHLPEHDLSDRHLSYDGNVGQNKVTTNVGFTSFNGTTKLGPQTVNDQQGKKSLGNVRVGPIVNGYRSASDANRQAPTGNGKIENHVTHYITFNKPFSRNVKPVDEPRIQEREKSPPKTLPIQQPKEVKEKREVKEPVEDKFESLSLKTSQESTLKSKSDISYILAASRLKKEIEDNLKRERELKDEGRVRTLSVDTVPSTPSELSASSSSVEATIQPQPRRLESEEQDVEVEKNVSVFKTLESTPREIKNEAQAQVKKFEAIAAQTQLEQQQQLKPLVKRESIPAAKPQQPVQHQPVQNVPTQQQQPQVGQVQQSPRQSMPNFKIGKNFNSMERYIMYSSLTKLNLRSTPSTPTSTVFSPTAGPSMVGVGIDAEQSETIEPQASSNESPFSRTEKEEISIAAVEPAEKIRKNYIPTEKKIKDELLEMVQREEELKKNRQQWKSTPNLSNLNLSEDEEEMGEIQLREVPTKRVAEKRRRSALISKWEEMISKYNQ